MVADYQFSFGGLTIGDGTMFEVHAVSGLDDRDMNLLTPSLPRYHGGLIGASYHQPRVVSIRFDVHADHALALAAAQADLAAKRDTIRAAFAPAVDTESVLAWKLPGLAARRIECRADKLAIRFDVESEYGIAEATVQLVASDPAMYADTESTLVLSPYVSAAGLSYPVTYPKAYGSGGSGGGESATNEGTWETWPTITITGPSSGTLTNPVLENVTTGKTLSLTANGGTSITTGQTLVIESHPRDRTVAFTTGASRYGTVSGDFWPLVAGANELRFRASGTTTGAAATVAWRSAWI